MMHVVTSLLLFISFVASSGSQLLAGQQCLTPSNDVGICKRIDSCERALREIHQNKRPTICSFDKKIPIVCCAVSPECGNKARKMCEEYSLVTRNKRNVSPHNNESSANGNYGVNEIVRPIVGGHITLPKVYPHMAAIGFGDESSISWLCGGSLISEQFVLTAAHCVSAGRRGLARWVLLGVLDLATASTNDRAQLFSVAEWIRYPDFSPRSHYDDIALLKLDREVSMNDYVRPACLQVRHDINRSSAVASGWGFLDWGDERGSNYLMSVELQLIPTSVCNISFRSLMRTQKLMFGLQDDKMLCAGEKTGGKDTCEGDSGGPLQYSLDENRRMSSVVGITSFGSTVCGAKDSPAVYTRVSYYVPWIEGIVWP